MAPRSLASSSLKSDTKLKSTLVEGGDMYTRRHEYEQPGSPYNKKVTPRASESEDLSAFKPRLEGFCRGSWWEVDIMQHRDKYFLAKYLSPTAGEEDAWLPLHHLRLKSRKSDDWDCNILKRGVDVSVNCTHPDYKELKLHSRAMYDAKIAQVTRATHSFECTCRFYVRFYCANTEDPIGCTRERDLVDPSSATRDVAISNVSILQQPGIVPFYEILKSHLSKKWIPVSRWSNDAFFLRETKLNLHVPQNYGENWLPDEDEGDDLDEALVNTPARKLDEPELFSYSFGIHHSREQQTVKVPVAKARACRDPGQFPGSEKKNRAEDFTATGIHPTREDTNVSKAESDTDAARGGMNGGASRKDSESRGAKAASIDRDTPQLVRPGSKRSRDDVPVSSRKKHGLRTELIIKVSAGEQKESERPNRNPSNGQDRTATSSGEGNLEDQNVDIGGGSSSSSDESDVRIQPPLKRVVAKNLQTSGRRSDEGVEKRGRPRFKRDDGSSDRKLDGRSEKITSQKGTAGWGLADKTRLKRDDGSSDRKLDGRSEKITSQKGTAGVGFADKTRLKRDDGSSDRKLDGRSEKITSQKGTAGAVLAEKTRLKTDDGSSDRKLDGRSEKITSQKGTPGAGLAETKDDEQDCEVLETDPPDKGTVAGQTEGLNAGRKKVDRIDTPPSEGHKTVLEPRKPLRKLRARSSGKKQVPGTGASIPAGLRYCPPKPHSGKGNGIVKKPERPLYLDVLEDNRYQEKEKRIDNTVETEMLRKPKHGLNDSWNPKEFRYDIPTLEQKQAERQQQQQHSEHLRQQQMHQQQQPKQSAADIANGSEEVPREEKVSPPDQEREVCTCGDPEAYLKEDVGMICRKCAVVLIAIEDLVPTVGMRQPRHSGEASDWDVGRRSPDAFQETTEYQNLQSEKDVTWMSSCSLPRRIQLAMHPHQKDGFAFLWRNLACGEGSYRRMREDRNAGCILSHAPGTGKTFLVIAFLQSYMSQFPACIPLIVAPKIMLRQWEKEFQRWKSDISVYILNTAQDSGKRLIQIHEEAGVIPSKNHHLNQKRQLDTYRLAMLYEWTKTRSVILVSYNLFSCLTDESRDYSVLPERELIRNMLLEKSSLLVLDEGHFPRNKGTRIRRSLMTVRTNIRILLSGTLFQNNFEELFNTLYLVRPGFVEGFARFVPNSSHEDRHSNLKKFLEIEQVTKEAERRARKLFVEEVGMKIEQGQSSKAHSDKLEYGLERLGALTSDFVHHHTGEVLGSLPGLRDFALILKPTQQQCSLLELVEKNFYKPSQYLEREIAVSQTSIHPVLVRGLEFAKFLDINSIFRHYVELKTGSGKLGTAPGSIKSFASGLSKKEAMDPSDGVKTKFVFDLLQFSKPSKEKVLIFSQHITPLDLLADMFIAQFGWKESVEYLKLDGKLSLDDRARIIEKFNNPSSEACVLLASTKACGEGISLIGASRVVFLDVLWNPAVIKQAMSRAFRLGQKKIVYVYRLIASGTIEENKYKKAIRKDWLSRSIFSSSEGESHKGLDAADENAGKVRTAADGGQRGTKDISLDGISERVEEACGQEMPNDGDKKVSVTSRQEEDEDVHRLRKIQALLAWEVDVTTCKDVMLEKVLAKDKCADRKTFFKVIEHGSDFREKTVPFGPDAREWFLEGLEDNEPLDMKEVNDAEADAIVTDSDEEDM